MSEQTQQENFAALYAKAHMDLLRFVLSLVPFRDQAEDIVQETARLLFQKFEQYDPNQPFLPWARQFAYFEVLKHRKKQAVRSRIFSDDLVELLAEERQEQEGLLAAQRDALTGCLNKLNSKARKLLMDHFGHKIPTVTLAEQEGKSPNALYVSMHRIRQKLIQCVQRVLKSEGWSR